MLSNANSFVCTQLNGFKFRKWLHIYIWLIEGILAGTANPGQSRHRSKEGVLHISQSSRTGVSPLDAVGDIQDTGSGAPDPSVEMQSAYSTVPADTAASISIRYPAKTITDADYADDIALLANTPAQAKTLLHSLERAAAGIGLHVNEHKTEYMCFNQTGDIYTLNGSPLELVYKFTYLGSSVSSIRD